MAFFLANWIIRIKSVDQHVGINKFIKIALHELVAARVNRSRAQPLLHSQTRIATVGGFRLRDGSERDSDT